eukprot:12314254-Ditylum_brightwellii.AAC.1
MGVRLGFSYFGHLHKKEILLVNVEDVTFSTEKNIYQEPTCRFLKNMHKGAKCNQNMGKSVLAKLPKMTAKIIKIDPQDYTDICWRRSGAIAMANKGESTINLKHAGCWQSNK